MADQKRGERQRSRYSEAQMAYMQSELDHGARIANCYLIECHQRHECQLDKSGYECQGQRQPMTHSGLSLSEIAELQSEANMVSADAPAAHVGPSAAHDAEFREMIDRSVQRRQLEQAVVVAAMAEVKARESFTDLDIEYAANDGFRKMDAYREFSVRQDAAELLWKDAQDNRISAVRALMAFEKEQAK